MLAPMPDEPWDKVLWKKQPYPDNYVPEGLFLSSLRRNRERNISRVAMETDIDP